MCRSCGVLEVSKRFVLATIVLASLVAAGVVAAQTTASSVRTTDAGQIAGETVLIVGQGFAAYESVDLDVVHADGTAEPGMGHGPWTVVTGADGKFVTTWIINATDAAGDAFVVTAQGGFSGASSAAAFDRMAIVNTDKFNYAAAETAAIAGAGFVAGEGVTLRVVHAGGSVDAGAGHDPWTVTADAAGNIASSMPISSGDPLSSEYILTAKGVDSGLSAGWALSALVCPPTPPPDTVIPLALPSVTCPPNLNSCTANDVVTTVVAAEPLGGDNCGTLADDLSLQFTVKFETTANQRFDLGVFVSEDGGTLNNGSGNTPPTALACIGDAPQVGDGDGNADTADCDSDLFLDLDPTGHSPTPNALDTCGDLQQNAGPVFLTVTATVSCSTIDSNFHLKVPSCRVWEQNANHQGVCTTLSQAGTGSKCDCTALDFTQVLDPCVTALCDDENVCTEDSCTVVGGVAVCHHDPVDNGTSCDDDTVCNGHEECVDGDCAPGTDLDCDDDNVCTDDFCDPDTGCYHTNNTDPCSDGNACTTGDVCDGGTCNGGSAPNCDDGNVCTTDSCDPDTGCVNEFNTNPCDDGNACTTPDVCGGGTCNGGPPPNCDDGNVCTIDSCNPATGCVNDPGAANGNPCDDSNACTGVIGNEDVCQGGSCQPGGTVDCNDSNPCTNDSCDPATGCVNTNNTNPCDDGNACTTPDVCGGGTCNGGPPPNCDDGDVCTTDTCNPASGCVHTPNTDPCDDGNACTTGDVCGGGSQGCAGTGATNCDDGNICTDDACDPATGCYHTNNTNPCDDGNACTTPDVCGGGTCNGGPPPNCDDGNGCTDDACNPASGCYHTNNTNPCNDGNACTTPDVCGGGTCNGGPPPNCDDGDVCTTDTCNPASGCVHTPNTNPCDDGNACTTGDVCGGGSQGCAGTGATNCDDGNICTDDACDPATGCYHTNNTNPCDDGNACTTPDVCGGGTCNGGPAPNCDDGNPCTDDSCDPAQGCVHKNNENPCDDGNGCTTGDVCSGGGCVGGPPPNCNDNNPCTDESCDPASGCVHTNNSNPCSDGNACTTGDVCSGGACQGGPALDCNDNSPCTDDSCNPASGCVHTSNDLCHANPKTQGYWRRLCAGPHPEGSITQADVECVNDSCTFASIHTIAELCDRLTPNPSNDKCEQAESQFMATMLNYCQDRLTDASPIVSACTSHTTAGESRAEADSILCNGPRTQETCTLAQCESEELNSGKALQTNSLRLSRLADGSLRLAWDPPYGDSDFGPPSSYKVMRRASTNAPYEQIVSTPNLIFVDTTSVGLTYLEYEIVPVW